MHAKHKRMIKVTGKYIFFMMLFVTGKSAHGNSSSNLPGIYIERLIDSSATIQPALKSRYEQCVKLKEINMRQYNEQPEFWDIASSSLTPEYVKNINTPPQTPPSWTDEKIGFSRKKEYFYKNKYILIHEYFDYNFTQNGLCQLLKTKKEKRIIDTGVHTYHSDSQTAPRKLTKSKKANDTWMNNDIFIRNKINKHTNTTPDAEIMRNELTEANKGNEDILKQKLNALLKNLNDPKSQQKDTPKDNHNLAQSIDNLTEKMTDAFDLKEMPITKNNTLIAGQACDWVESGTLGARICYWRTSHTYPSNTPRSIILKKEYNNTTEKATTFRHIEKIPKQLLSPPAKI